MRFSAKVLRLAAVLGALCAFGAPASVLAARVIYVDAGATGAQDGTSWDDAYTDLQDALADAGQPGACTPESPCEIWVAAGVYNPDRGTGDRYATFQMQSNVALYGGFAGGETSLDQRNVLLNETLLSGDLSGDDGPEACPADSNCCAARDEPGCDDPACEETLCSLRFPWCCTDAWNEGCALLAALFCCALPGANNCENSQHVLTGSWTDETAVLDGFTIADGNAHDQTPDPILEEDELGGGIYNEGGSPAISNCTFRENRAYYGGGMYNSAGAAPTLRNCLFVDNLGRSGGGMVDRAGDTTLIGCTFTGNTSPGGAGGMFTYFGSTTLIDCIFDENWGGSGGGISTFVSDALLIRCAFTRNRSRGDGGGMVISGGYGTTELIDCVFVGNSAAWVGGGVLSPGTPRLNIRRCTFIGNSATAAGALWLDGGATNITDSIFSDNAASGADGGISMRGGSVAMTNCVVTGNVTDRWTSAIRSQSTFVRLTNCIISGNRTIENGQAIESFAQSSMIVTNSIVWGNSNRDGFDESAQFNVGSVATLAVDHSVVQGWTGVYGGVGNIGDDPLFVQEGYWDDPGTADDLWDDVWVTGDYHLTPDSPCINAGDSGALYLSDHDLDGHARVLCGQVDMGPYEFGIGDYDCDHVVDLFDFANWPDCMTDPGAVSVSPCSRIFDFNADDAVDLSDFAAFQNAFGPGE